MRDDAQASTEPGGEGGSRSPVDTRALEQAPVRGRPRYYTQQYEQNCSEIAPAGALPHLNGSTGLLTGRCGYLIPEYSSTTQNYSSMASASYVTGSHAIKFGMTNGWGKNSRTFAPNADINTLITLNGVVPGVNDFPVQVAVYNTPTTGIQRVNSDFGSYAQDTWTMKRLTLNYGARFDHFNAGGAGGVGAGVDVDRGAQLPGDSERSRLERLVGASRRRVRHHRRRQDGVQGECGQIRRLPGGRLRPDVQRHERRDTNTLVE